jgi:protein-tyrosine phosphatase
VTPRRILFVCLGNICRSPTAEGVMRRLIRENGLEHEIEVDSAGTGGWHIGAPPDARATEAAARRGTELAGSARRFDPERDFDRFDLVVAMDADNRRDLLALAPDDEARAKVRMFLAGDRDVPDPYYGGADGFDEVLDLVEEAAAELLDELRQ